MLIIDKRREGDRAPLPANWGLLPDDEGDFKHLLWIVDLDRPELYKWGLGEVRGAELIVWVGPKGGGR
jgi:hypothetical protein